MAEEAPAYDAAPPEEKIDLDNPEFQALWSLVRDTRQSVFLTGKAGTGKSTFLRYIISHTTKQLAVLAPTGLAAINVRGQTIHSFFHLPLPPVLPDDPNFAAVALGKRLNISRKMIDVLRSLELIIIDEISMVRADVIDIIDKILRTFGGDRRKP
ncbi:MAG: AAA family ATPase, partial [Muribaculaceae bacterium]|nr:AAA family ATPase [Muribaculaceae bacterium]